MEEKKAEKSVVFRRYHTIVVGSGAAGLNAALRLHEMGQTDIAIITEGMRMGTSRNTGSDKQTYYKLSLGGEVQDSVRQMAATLFEGGCVDGDIALAEAANSIRSFFHLVELGVPFPINESGEYIGYKTDHDPINRGTSAGPYTSKYMTEALEKRVTEAKIPVWDRHLAVRLLTRMENGEAAAAGVIALDLSAPEDAQLVVFAAANVVWATGGEAGMYQASVYPYAHSGATGLLFEAGATGKNLTESQYGVASTSIPLESFRLVPAVPSALCIGGCARRGRAGISAGCVQHAAEHAQRDLPQGLSMAVRPQKGRGRGFFLH